MNLEGYTPLGLLTGSFLLVLVLSYLTQKVSEALGFVTRPKKSKETRWNQRSVALGGGIAIQIGLQGGIWLVDPQLGMQIGIPLLILSSMGLIDDAVGLSPIAKLIGQFIAAAYVVSVGYLLELPVSVAGMMLSILWIVSITNALNLVDNMDGLAAGVTAISAATFYFLFQATGQAQFAQVSLVLLGSSLGFLVLNFHPAKLFMGDAGSLAFGFLLATLSTKIRFAGEVAAYYSIVPILFVLIVPIFDMCLVIISRRNVQKPVMSGGKDHTSHRLVSLGITESRAVFMLYLMGGIGGLIAWRMVMGQAMDMVILGVLSAVLFLLMGVFLSQIAVYPEMAEKSENVGMYGPQYLPTTFRYALELAIDLCTISISWTLAHWIRFHELGLGPAIEILSVVRYWPYVIGCKLVAIAFFRLYRGLWQNVLSYDVYRIFKGAALGSLLLVIVLALLNRLQDLSRMVIVLDFALTFFGLLGTRAALSGFRRWSRKLASGKTRAAFLGSPLLAPQIQQAVNDERRIEFAGTISTDPQNKGNGTLGSIEDIEAIVENQKIQTLFVEDEKYVESLGKLISRGLSIRCVRIVLT